MAQWTLLKRFEPSNSYHGSMDACEKVLTVVILIMAQWTLLKRSKPSNSCARRNETMFVNHCIVPNYNIIQVFQTEGMRGFYKGFPLFAMGIFFGQVYITAFEYTKHRCSHLNPFLQVPIPLKTNVVLYTRLPTFTCSGTDMTDISEG